MKIRALKTLQKYLKTHKHVSTLLLLGGAICIFIAGGVLLWAATLQLPDVAAFQERKIEQSTKIYDRTGNVLLYDLHQNIQRTSVPFDSISRNVKNATVAIEDAEFYQHHGIQIKSIIRAVLVNLTSIGFTQGGSTITQQVIKNSLLTQQKTITRKIKEWILAIKLEDKLSKEEILGLYLNEAPYGGSIYGVEEASRNMFGKHASELTLAQSAYLAALPQAPTYYSPYGSHKDKLEERKNLVLRRMQDLGFITAEEFDTAKNETVQFLPRSDHGIKAPHFVFYIRDYLEEKYGEQAIEDGLRVTTTLDYDLQEKAEEIIKRGALENEKNFNASNAALTAVDPKTGQILVMVGSRDYFDKEIEGNFNITTAPRQPGSSFKPFVYATALKKGYTPNTVVFDLQTQFSTACEPGDFSDTPPCYSPENYDHVFRGPVTFRNALAQSINVPAVKVLYLAGIGASIQTAQNLGISTLTDPKRYGLTLVLGGGEVKLLEMVGAYGVFAQEGLRSETTGILKVEDGHGTVLEEFTPHRTPVLDRNVALQISDMLSDNNARTPAFGERSSLYFPDRQVAAKTGTTNDYRDAWIIGYTPSLAVGAWAGNNNNTPMEKKVAGFIIAPIWHEFMEVALQKFPVESFPAPEIDTNVKPVLRGIWQGGETYTDPNTISPSDPNGLEIPSQQYVIPNVHSILYWVDKDNPRGPIPSNPASDPQYLHWEIPVRAWAAANGYGSQPQPSGDIGLQDHNPISTQNNALQIDISRLRREYDIDDTVSFSVSADGKNALTRFEVFVNNVYVGRVDNKPFSFSFVPEKIDGIKKTNTLKVVGYDAVLNKDTTEEEFRVDL